jgi:hypothetical protein
MRISALLLIASLPLVAGCNEHNPPAGPSNLNPTSFTQIYSGTLSRGGSGFFSFSVPEQGTLAVMLASLTLTGTTTLVSTPVSIEVGVPAGTGCAPLGAGGTSTTATPALSSQIRTSIAAGTYCIRISDPGTLTTNTDFLIRFVYPNAPTLVTAPDTETFASNLTVNGTATRSFISNNQGALSITLTDLGGSDTLVARVGVGVMANDGTGCRLSSEIQTTAGPNPQISSPIDGGTFCLRISDAGRFADTVSFSIRLVHP